MERERLSNTLQENLMTLLAYSDQHGKILAKTTDADLYEGDYGVIVRRCLSYWAQYNQAPKLHLADLFDDILGDPNNRRATTYKRILQQMLQLSQSINAEYAMARSTRHSRVVRMKQAILQSAEKINANDDMAVDEVEAIWAELLRDRNTMGFDPGIKLTDVDVAINKSLKTELEFTTGIPEMDFREAAPARGELMVFLAPTGFGKTWWLVHCGKLALHTGKRVLHVSLEMSQARVMQRYYMALFSAAKRYERSEITRLITEDNAVIGFEKEQVAPRFAFDSEDLRLELDAHLATYGSRYDDLMIKQFPSRQLTVRGLEAFLDNLEATEGFIPDMLNLDYLGILKTDPKNHRIDLGLSVADLRGLAIERGMAVNAPHQISRAGAEVSTVRMTHIAEDWSIVQTADIVVTMSRTESEKQHGLARLYLNKVRNDEDGYGVLITQNYRHGQFALESAHLAPSYFYNLRELTKQYGDIRGEETVDATTDAE